MLEPENLLIIFFSFRFFLELMVKSMVENLGALQKPESHRKQRFALYQFLEEIIRLVVFVTTDILFRQLRDGKYSWVSCNLFLLYNYFL